MRQLKVIIKKVLGISLALLLLLPLGISLAQPSEVGANPVGKTTLGAKRLRKPFFGQPRSLRPGQSVQDLRELREEIKDKIFILRAEGRLIKAVLEENANPPEEFRNFAQKARQHALKARELLRETREIIQTLRSRREELTRNRESGSLAELGKDLKNKFIQIRNLMRKASHELDLAIFFAEKALATLGK